MKRAGEDRHSCLSGATGQAGMPVLPDIFSTEGGTTMPDTFTKVTTQSYGSRIKESITGVLVGLVLVVVSFGGLFWNEGRTVKRAKTLEQGQGMVVTVKADQV